MDYTTWQQAANGPAALRQQELARHERSLPPPGEARIAADIGQAARAASFGGVGSVLCALGHLLDDLARLRRHAGDRAPEDATTRARDQARRPGARPRASWVMGRSARWHDDLARERQAVPVPSAGAAGTPAGALEAIRRAILRFRRRPRW